MFLSYCNKEIELNAVTWAYLYPYFLRFSIKNNIKYDIWDTYKKILIEEENKEAFLLMLENVFEELMNECYKEPTQKQITKHSSRFEKIIFKEKTYILNYVTDIVGIIGYRIHYIMNEIKN